MENRPHSRLILKFNYLFKNLNLFILFCYPYLSQVMKKWCKHFQGNIFLSLVRLNSMLSGSSLFCNSANNFIYQLFYHIKNLIKAHNLSSKRQHAVVSFTRVVHLFWVEDKSRWRCGGTIRRVWPSQVKARRASKKCMISHEINDDGWVLCDKSFVIE